MKTPSPLERKTALAALKLAAKKRWPDITLEQIATAARLPAGQVKKRFPDTSAILPVIVRLIDEEAGKAAVGAIDRKAPAHDRLFEAMMTRFDSLQTHRAAIRSIAMACRQTPNMAVKLFQSQVASMQHMLRVAHISPKGLYGKLQQAGLLAVYYFALNRWITDDSPDMAKTMSVLDRALQKGEKIMDFLSKID